MIDPVDLLFLELAHEQLIQFMGAFQIVPEWLLDDDTGALRVRTDIQVTQFFGDIRHQLRSDGEIENNIGMLPHLFFFFLYQVGDLLIVCIFFSASICK